MASKQTKPDYGIDAPSVLRNLFLFGLLALLLFVFTPRVWHLGRADLALHPIFAGIAICLLVEAALFLLYVRYGKFRHRDFMLDLHAWRGDEQALDVGCGRGLLLAGVAKRLAALGGSGRATGIDIWSNTDMGGNSSAATERNLVLEVVSARCTLASAGAQEMPFEDASFDVIVSNLCLHNIYDRATRRRAVSELARVLRPGGLALLSDYKLTGEYAEQLRELGFRVERRWGSWLTTFPPLRVVIVRKPG